jgi:HlyD family secretion protein
VHVTIWSSSDALTIPVAALFRQGDSWAAFAVRDGRAQVTPITIGLRNNRLAEVLSGLSVGARVVLHPSDRIKDGVRVVQRETH